MSRMAGVGRAEEVAYCEVEEVEVYCGMLVVDGRNSGDMTTWLKDSSVGEYRARERYESTDLLVFVLGISISN